MKEFRIYRPNKSNTGGALRLNPKEIGEGKYTDYEVMLEYAPQTGTDENGNASFAWGERDKNIIMKLGEIDIGEIISLISGRNNKIERFHKNPRNPDGSTILKMSKHNEGFYLNISWKENKEAKVVDGNINMSFGDGEILRILLTAVVNGNFGW